MANLKDIAKVLNVSVSTVSRALNDSDEISPARKEEVRAAAESLGYRLHGRGGRSDPEWNCAGIIVPELTSEYYAELVHLAKERLAAKGFSCVVQLTDFQPAHMVEAVSAMRRIRVKCLLVVMDTEETLNEQILHAFSKSGLPILLITSKYYPLLEFDCIHLNEYSGIVTGIRHLQERGYTRIGCIGDDVSMNRVTIFKQVMKLLDLPTDPRMICIGKERFEAGGYLRMQQMLALDQRPDAVFCCYDQMAIGAIHALDETGLEIPRDMALLGFDNLSMSGYIGPGITTIDNSRQDMISVAVNVLTSHVDNPSASRQQIALRPTLVVRGSA